MMDLYNNKWYNYIIIQVAVLFWIYNYENQNQNQNQNQNRKLPLATHMHYQSAAIRHVATKPVVAPYYSRYYF